MSEKIVLTIPGGMSGESLYNTIPAVPGGYFMFCGPLACTRHGMATAWEYQKKGRVSYLILSPEDMASGRYERTIAAEAKKIADEKNLSCLGLLMHCQNAIIGTDYLSFEESLEDQLGIPVRIMEVNRLHMHAKVKKKKPLMNYDPMELVFSFIEKCNASEPKTVNLIGTICTPEDEPFLTPLLINNGFSTKHISSCGTFEEFCSMAGSAYSIAYNASGETSAKLLRKHFGIPYTAFSAALSPDKVLEEYTGLLDGLGLNGNISEPYEIACEKLHKISEKLMGRDVIIDARMMPNGRELAMLLMQNGVPVSRVFTTRFSGKEEKAQEYLRENGVDDSEVRPEDNLDLDLPKPEPEPYVCNFGFPRLLHQLDILDKQLGRYGL